MGIFHASGDQYNLIIGMINWGQMHTHANKHTNTHTHTHTLNICDFNWYIWTVFHNLIVIQYAMNRSSNS